MQDLQKTVTHIAISGIVIFLVLFLGATLYAAIPLSEGTIVRESWNTSGYAWPNAIYPAGTLPYATLANNRIDSATVYVENATGTPCINNTDYELAFPFQNNQSIRSLNTTNLLNNTTAYADYNYDFRPATQAKVWTVYQDAMSILTIGLIIMAIMAIVIIVMKTLGRVGGGKDGFD